jgi:hypothetical protein
LTLTQRQKIELTELQEYMKLYAFITLIICCYSAGNLSGQSAGDMDALENLIGTENFQAMQNRPFRLSQLAFLNRHGYHVSELGDKEDASTFSDIASVEKIYSTQPDITLELAENGELNLLGYRFELDSDKETLYRFAGTGKVLVIPAVNLSLSMANLLNE